MLLATVLAVVSVLLGALLGLAGRRASWSIALIRAGAIGAGGAAVFSQFLPEAAGALGLWALLPFALGLVAPSVMERLASRTWKDHGALALELGYAGLVVHQLGDGIALGAYTGPTHAGHEHVEVFASIAGHTVPVVATLVLGFAAKRSATEAVLRALGLAAAVVAGVSAAHVPAAATLLSDHQGWVDAVVAGLVLHVVLHGVPAATVGFSRARLGELLALLAGVGLVLVASRGAHAHELGAHDHGAEAVHHEGVATFVVLGCAFAMLAAFWWSSRERGCAHAHGDT